MLCEAADQFQGEPTEAVGLDKLIEIHVEELSRYAKMTSKVEALREVNHAVSVLGILNLLLVRYHWDKWQDLPSHAASVRC